MLSILQHLALSHLVMGGLGHDAHFKTHVYFADTGTSFNMQMHLFYEVPAIPRFV